MKKLSVLLLVGLLLSGCAAMIERQRQIQTMKEQCMTTGSCAAYQTYLMEQQAQQGAWQNSVNMLNYNYQQQQNRSMLMTPQPIAPVTCQQFGSIIQCR